MAKHIVSPSDFKKNAAGQVKKISSRVGLKDLKKRIKVDSALYQQQKCKALEAEKYTSG